MINYIVDVLIIIVLFTVFGLIHSVLASNKLKIILSEKFGEFLAFYRLIYIFFSFLSLYVLYEISPKPDITIYDLPNPLDIVILIPQILSLAGFYWTLKYFSVSEFLGVSQILRWVNNQYLQNELDEKLTLRIKGPYRYCRHPLYFFSILFLISRPEMNLFYITLLICVISYFYIGSFYEERKLIKKFGDEYLIYQRQVPRIFPYNLFNAFKSESIS